MICLRPVVLAILVCLGFTATTARGDEHYYVLIFGSQSSPKLLRYTHTWATFVRVVGEGPNLANYQLEVNTISWLPASLNVRVWSPCPEKGVNLDLQQTLRYVYGNHESVTMWGPFVISRTLFDRSLTIRQLAENGAMRYRAIDSGFDWLIRDCIHAVTAIDPVFKRYQYPLIRVGKSASRYIAQQFMNRSLFDQYQYNNSWLVGRLGLYGQPIKIVPPQELPKRQYRLSTPPRFASVERSSNQWRTESIDESSTRMSSVLRFRLTGSV